MKKIIFTEISETDKIFTRIKKLHPTPIAILLYLLIKEQSIKNQETLFSEAENWWNIKIKKFKP